MNRFDLSTLWYTLQQLVVMTALEQIKNLIDRFESQGSDEGGVGLLSGKCLKILWAHGLMHKIRYSPKFMGVHSLNPGGIGFVTPI